MSNKTYGRCLLPGELEQQRKEELSQKRRFRILQVREQSKEAANDLRESVKKEKAKQLEKLKEDVLREKLGEKENALHSLQQLYHESVSDIGSGWRAAKNQAVLEEEMKVKSQLNNVAASERGQQALAECWKQNASRKESSNTQLQTRKFALEVEKERAAYIASLPLPEPDPVDALIDDSGKSKAVSDSKSMKRSDTNIEKADPSREPDACEAAQLETIKQKEVDTEKAQLYQKWDAQAKNRFQEAWKKKTLNEEYSKILKDIENEERLARNELRQKDYSKQNKYFMCPPLDKKIRSGKQAEMEYAVEKYFKEKREYDIEDYLQYDNGIEGNYSFQAIEKTEQNADITDYVEPTLRKPLLESDFEADDSRDEFADELNVAYIESPEQTDITVKSTEVEVLSSLLIRLRKRRAELSVESEERIKQLSAAVKYAKIEDLSLLLVKLRKRRAELSCSEEDQTLELSPEMKDLKRTHDKQAETSPSRTVPVQAVKVFPQISTGVQTVPQEYDVDQISERPASPRQVHVHKKQLDARVETIVQTDDLERTTVESVSTAVTKESSSTSYLSLPHRYGIPQLLVSRQEQCDICDVERDHTSHSSSGRHEPLLVMPDTIARPQVSAAASPLHETAKQIAEADATDVEPSSHSFPFEIPSTESLTGYMKRLMEKYAPSDGRESSAETKVKTVFPPIDLSTSVKYVEPFSVITPKKPISTDSEIAKISASDATFPDDELDSPADGGKLILSQIEQEQLSASNEVYADGSEYLVSKINALDVSDGDLRRDGVASDDEILHQFEIQRRVLLSQILDIPDEAKARQLQEYLLNINLSRPRPPIRSQRVTSVEFITGQELSTIQEMDSAASGSTADRTQHAITLPHDLSSPGSFHPLTSVPFDSHVDESSEHFVKPGSFRDVLLAHDDEARPQEVCVVRDGGTTDRRKFLTFKEEWRQFLGATSSSSESLRPLSLASHPSSTNETLSSPTSVLSSSESIHSLPTSVQKKMVFSSISEQSGVALSHPLVSESGEIQSNENVIARMGKISHASASTVSFRPLSSDYESSQIDADEALEHSHQHSVIHQQMKSTSISDHRMQSELSSGPLQSSVTDASGIVESVPHASSHQVVSVKKDLSSAVGSFSSLSEQVPYTSTSSVSIGPLSEDSPMTSKTMPKIIVSDHSAPATSIMFEGDEVNHFGLSLPSYFTSTKMWQHSDSQILTSTKKEGAKSILPLYESTLSPGFQLDPLVASLPLFQKPLASDSGGSFAPMSSHAEFSLSLPTADSREQLGPSTISGHATVTEPISQMQTAVVTQKEAQLPGTLSSEDSQISSMTLLNMTASNRSIPAASTMHEGDEMNHFGLSLPSYFTSTKMWQHSDSHVLTSTKKEGAKSMLPLYESPITPGFQLDPLVASLSLFRKPPVIDSRGSFAPMSSHAESSLLLPTADSREQPGPSRVSGHAAQITESRSQSPAAVITQKDVKLKTLSGAKRPFIHAQQFKPTSNLTKMVLLKEFNAATGSSKSISSSEESLASAFRDSKIVYQSTPVKAREPVDQEVGILEEPDLTLIGSEISCSMRTPPKKRPEAIDDTLISEDTYPSSSSSQASYQGAHCPSVESLEQKRDCDKYSEGSHLRVPFHGIMSPISENSVISASLLSFEKHERELSDSRGHLHESKDLVSSDSIPSPSSSALTVLPCEVESPFGEPQASSQNNTPVSGSSKLLLKSSTDYKSRTKRLWNNLSEVQQKKLAEEKKLAFVKNREKVRELEMKIQKARKSKTPRKK